MKTGNEKMRKWVCGKMLSLIISFTLLPIVSFTSQADATTFLSKSNFAWGTTSSTIDNAAGNGDTFTITAGTNSGAFPASGSFLVVVYSSACTTPSTCATREIIKISGISGSTMTISARDQESTSHSGTWGVGTKIDHIITAGTLTEISDATTLTIASQTSGDILYYNGSAWARMAKGANNTLFGVDNSGTVGYLSTISLTSYEVDAIPVSWFIDGTTAPASLATVTSTNKAKYRDFQGSADNDVFFEWSVPYGIDTTVSPTFQVEGWVTNATAPANGETIKFKLQCASVAHSELLSSTLPAGTTVTFTADATLVQYDRVITGYSGALTITGLAAGELVLCHLTRDTTDTYGQTFGVGWIKIKYARATQGS